MLLLAAGTLVCFFGIRLLRRDPGCARRGRPSWLSVRGGPALGAATVLLPCGVTLSMEMVAVSTGSPARGALVMGAFAAGSTPAFLVLGLVVRRLAASRLVKIAGVVAIAAGVVTAASGLRLAGWEPVTATAAVAAVPGGDGTQRLTVWATGDGYRPGVTAARAGHPLLVTFRTRGGRGCTRTLSIEGRDLTLPETGAVTVRLAARPPGTVRYTCGMGMYAGFIRIS